MISHDLQLKLHHPLYLGLQVHPFQREMTLYKQLESMGFLTFRNSEPDDK